MKIILKNGNEYTDIEKFIDDINDCPTCINNDNKNGRCAVCAIAGGIDYKFCGKKEILKGEDDG